MTNPRPSRFEHWWQPLAHAIGVVGGWALFAWAWHDVASKPWDTESLWLLIVGSLLAAPAITAAWVLHNLAIYRRKGPRRGVPAVDARYDRDFNGREVKADWQALSSARFVVVELHGAEKRYREAAGPATLQPAVAGAGAPLAAAPPSERIGPRTASDPETEVPAA